MHQAPLQTYAKVQANSCNSGNLLLLYYSKTRGEIQKAMILMESSNEADRLAAQSCLVKAHLGVLELDKTLNFEALPALAEALHKLYLHILLLLGEGMTEGNGASLQRAHAMLGELQDSWEQAVRQTSKSA